MKVVNYTAFPGQSPHFARQSQAEVQGLAKSPLRDEQLERPFFVKDLPPPTVPKVRRS